MTETPQIVETAPQNIAKISLFVPREEIRNIMGPGIREVFATVLGQGIAVTGPWFTYHRRRPNETFDFDICVPIASPITPAGRVENGVIEATSVARTIYRGPYEKLDEGWCELHAWVKAHGHRSATPLWEAYVVGPESDPNPENWQTELNQPLAANPEEENDVANA